MKRPPLPPVSPRRQSSTPHYQTFPTAPPRTRGKQPLYPATSLHGPACDCDENTLDQTNESPLPRRQLAILAVIALAEQTALNSISPYLPQMVSSFPSTDPSHIGLYVGAIASAFAASQFVTNYFWGYLSDRVGRKPIILLGTLLTAVGFVAFGFCTKLWQAVLVQAFIGLVNGNQGVISTCLGEITDRSNQSRAFVWLPVIYGLGSITGPALGGLLVGARDGDKVQYPYVLPNLASAAILLLDLVLIAMFLEESLEEVRELPPLKDRVGALFAWMWQFAAGAVRPTYLRRRRLAHHAEGDAAYSDTSSVSSARSSLLSLGEVFVDNSAAPGGKAVLNRDTLLLLGTYLVFQLSNASFNTLYLIFADATQPLGREIDAGDIGISLSAAGAATIVFQVCLFGRLRSRLGNKRTYRLGLGMFAVAMLSMPLVSYRSSAPLLGIWTGTVWMWLELSLVLLMKTVASVGGLTAVMLLITNSAPGNGSLGRLNGLAQTLGAAGRAVGPLVAGGLFTMAAEMGRSGGWVPFGVFGGVAAGGWVASWGIRGEGLESGGEMGESDEEDGEEEEEV